MEKSSDWIRRNPYPEHEEFFKDIEKALGFELFVWQKTLIVEGTYRQSGRTTAEIIRELIAIGDKPIDYSRKQRNMHTDFYIHELLKIKEKLEAAGVKTRPVFLTERDKKNWIQKKEEQKNINDLLEQPRQEGEHKECTEI